MASIGGISCAFVKGQGNALKPRIELWNRPGVSGYGAMVLGNGDSPFAFTAVAFGTAAAVVAWMATLEALQGQVVTIVDDWATTWTNMLVNTALEVSRSPRRDLDGNGVCRGEMRIEGVKIV